MNEKERLKIAFESIAHREVPETENLWPRIAAKIERKDIFMYTKLKSGWAIILVLLGLILATTAAYALYRYFSDPGLQAVSDAGMFTDLDVIAPLTPETKDDLTATLISAYVDTHRLAFVVHFEGWKEGNDDLGPPSLQDASGAVFGGSAFYSPSESDPATWTISIEPPNGLPLDRFEGKLILRVIPAVLNDSQVSQFTEFDFDLDLPIYKLLVWEPKQSVTAHGVEMIIEKVEMSPSYSKLYLSVNSNENLSGNWITWAVLTLNQDANPIPAQKLPVFNMGTDEDLIIETITGQNNIAGFPIGYENHPKILTLTIYGFSPSIGNPHSAELVTAADLKAAQEKLEAQGIEVSYTESNWAGDGFAVKKKPENMSEEQVRVLFYETVGIYYSGPWVFTIEINQ